ncbi:hypothetical protein [Algibacter sp. L1A34]|uniref:hypothetical protein n=1 Tax=Algibacter sp. L1A34 TaxID=2686365 RepID=UPI00131E882A|nr:hypothetical protein [Algibacter sp. L1A34]
MDTILNTDVTSVINKAEIYCSQQGIDIDLVYKLPESVLEIISERSKELPTLYFVSVDLLRRRIKNGCFLLRRGDEIYGHIFAHEHHVKGRSVYERACLWVNRDFRNYNLGLLLMSRMTELFTESFLISIAQTPKVHYYNELLGMTHVTLAQMSTVLVEELEKLGKLRDELNYRYYVNPCFEAESKQLK